MFGMDSKERQERERQTLTNLDISAATFRRHASSTEVPAVSPVHEPLKESTTNEQDIPKRRSLFSILFGP